jgi:hypothetical protein
VIALLLATALAADPSACGVLQPVEAESLAVAWVSPSARQVGQKSWLTVVPAADLRRWIQDHEPSPARLLQHLGLRKKGTVPSRRWKITILEVSAGALCRPLADLEPGTPLASLAVCPRQDRTVTGRHEGCGYSEDLATGERGADLFAVPWHVAASNGFCVLPLERFIDGR